MQKTFFNFFPILAMGLILSGMGNFYKKEPASLPIDTGGPFVMYSKHLGFVKYITDENGVKTAKVDSFSIADKAIVTITVTSDEPGKTFDVAIKPELEIENSEYRGIKKILVISDIEGEFRAFRRLLQANAVMDKDFNWTFGDGHLVLTGDFFDRGKSVTQVLWLIYSLEEKAKQAGGYVHFILGNHEIMNLSGDLRYVNKKYFKEAALIGENYLSLYGKNSELGKWLRTKNIIEKVGDILFVHAGVSSEVNELNLSTSRLNKIVRPFYDDSTYKYPNYKVDLLYGELGPFWYRGYYLPGFPGNPIERIDSTLSIYNVKHISTGHTVIADTISSLYQGKLFNTDVSHHNGRSEALLFENDNFYRVDGVGQKFLIAQ